MKEQIIIEEALEEERKRTEEEKRRADEEKRRADIAERGRNILMQQLIDAGITPAEVPQ